MQIELTEVTSGLIDDMKSLRAGKITNADARVRAQLAREILRSVHLQLEGIKLIESKARPTGIEESNQ